MAQLLSTPFLSASSCGARQLSPTPFVRAPPRQRLMEWFRVIFSWDISSAVGRLRKILKIL